MCWKTADNNLKLPNKKVRKAFLLNSALEFFPLSCDQSRHRTRQKNLKRKEELPNWIFCSALRRNSVFFHFMLYYSNIFSGVIFIFPASSNSDTDLQRLMALQAAGMPLMDAGTAAALAFGGVGGLNPLSAGMSSMMMPGASGTVMCFVITVLFFLFRLLLLDLMV